MEKIFFHIDVNSAYLSWESARRKKLNPEAMDLRDIPSAVTGDPSRRSGIVLAKSIPAKKFGIKTGEPIQMARKKCPQLYAVAADFDLYIENSNNMMTILRDFSPNVYQYSIDEAFLDMTGTQRLFGEPVQCADLIRKRMREELGFTVNVGIGNTMTTAKMAGDFSKPDKTHTLYSYEVESKMWPLPIEELFFVGRKSSRKLRNMGIETIGELANMDVDIVRRKLKSYGEVIHNHANGREGYVFLNTKIKNKSVGNSTTTPFDICDYNTADTLILSLCETVCARLRQKDMDAKVVAIELVDIVFNRRHMQSNLQFRTNNVREIFQEASSLLRELWDGTPLRHIGVSTSKVEKEDASQLSFLEEISSKEDRLYRALDSIRFKYGDDSIKRAIFVNNEISSMEGGTSKNKKNGIVYL